MEFFNLKLIVSIQVAGRVLIFIGAFIFLKWLSQCSLYVAYSSLFFLPLKCGSTYSLDVEFTLCCSSSDGIGTHNAIQPNLSLLTEG